MNRRTLKFRDGWYVWQKAPVAWAPRYLRRFRQGSPLDWGRRWADRVQSTLHYRRVRRWADAVRAEGDGKY